jgi:hypothetical protein
MSSTQLPVRSRRVSMGEWSSSMAPAQQSTSVAAGGRSRRSSLENQPQRLRARRNTITALSSDNDNMRPSQNALRWSCVPGRPLTKPTEVRRRPRENSPVRARAFRRQAGDSRWSTHRQFTPTPVKRVRPHTSISWTGTHAPGFICRSNHTYATRAYINSTHL